MKKGDWSPTSRSLMKLVLIYKLRKVIMSLAKKLKIRLKSTMLNLRIMMLPRSPRRISCVGYAQRSTPSSSAHIPANSVGAKDTNLRRVGLNFQKKPLDTYLLLGRILQHLRRTQRTLRRGRPEGLNLQALTGVLILRLLGVNKRVQVAGEGEPDIAATVLK